MATQAKRYGLEVRDDLEMELRLRRIEQQLERLVGAGDLTEDGDTKRLNTPPQVTGLRVLGSVPGAITLGWNAVPISDLRRYELDIAEDIAFTVNKQTFNVAGTSHQFSTVSAEGGGGGTVIFARVRARNRAGVAGPYSVTLNTATGQAQTEDIGEGQVETENISNTTLEGITVVTSDGTHTFNPTTLLNFNPSEFYLAGDNSLGDDPIVNLINPYLPRESSLIDLPTGTGQATFTHNLGRAPKDMSAFLVNLIDDEGYIQGDHVPINIISFGSDAAQGILSSWFNSTLCGVTFNDEPLRVPHKTTGDGDTNLTRTRWRVKFFIER